MQIELDADEIREIQSLIRLFAHRRDFYTSPKGLARCARIEGVQQKLTAATLGE